MFNQLLHWHRWGPCSMSHCHEAQCMYETPQGPHSVLQLGICTCSSQVLPAPELTLPINLGLLQHAYCSDPCFTSKLL